MKGTVDRTEGSFAACQMDGGGFMDIPLGLFPEKPKSGDVFCLNGDAITMLKDETKDRSRKAQHLFAQLKERENKGRMQ